MLRYSIIDKQRTVHGVNDGEFKRGEKDEAM